MRDRRAPERTLRPTRPPRTAGLVGQVLTAVRARWSQLSFRGTPSAAPLFFAGLNLACAWLLFAPAPASAVITTDQGAPAVRRTTPVGLASDEVTVFELQGRFRSFLGTPIEARYFLTAQHIGISASDTITFDAGPNAGTYSIVTWFDDPSSDLRIVEIAGTFASWAALYAAPDETGKVATIFGRGGAPNGEIVVNSELKGWSVAAPDGPISWGHNVVTNTIGNQQIYAAFENFALNDEAGLSLGDSGGAWFIRDGQGLLRLAGISEAVTGPFQRDDGFGSPDGLPFTAPLFDIGGLWFGQPGSAVLIAENPVNTPAIAIAARVSNRFSWIASIVNLSTLDSDDDAVPNDVDNCPFTANPTQQDSGGLGYGSPSDGIGNACQCGDITGDGQVTDTDAAFIKRQALGLAAPLFLSPENCDVSGDGKCSGIDGTLVRHAAAGAPPEAFGQNCASALPQ